MKHYVHRGARVQNRDEARRRLDAHIAAGYPPARIADMVGLHDHNLARLVSNPNQRIAQATVNALLTLPAKPAPWVVGATRRLQALACLGWGLYDLSERTGIPRATLSGMRSRVVTTLRSGDDAAGRIAAIVSAYDELSMTQAPIDRFHNRSRADARRRGWAPPLAWDDDTIDDPSAEPNLGARTPGRPTAALPDPSELVAQVNRSGMFVVAERYGVSSDTVWRHLKRAGYRAVTRADQGQLPTYMKGATA